MICRKVCRQSDERVSGEGGIETYAVALKISESINGEGHDKFSVVCLIARDQQMPFMFCSLVMKYPV